MGALTNVVCSRESARACLIRTECQLLHGWKICREIGVDQSAKSRTCEGAFCQDWQSAASESDIRVYNQQITHSTNTLYGATSYEAKNLRKHEGKY